MSTDSACLNLSGAILSQQQEGSIGIDNAQAAADISPSRQADFTSGNPKPVHATTNVSERLSDTAGAVREVTKKLGKTRIKWDNPESTMIITKPGDVSLISLTWEVALWLIRAKGLTVYVDAKLKTMKRFRYQRMVERFPDCKEKLQFWDPELCAAKPKLFSFIITLGGDGTVLFTSWLFQSYVPPVIPFGLGSLGFLTPFEFEKYDQYLTQAMARGVRINMRGRITCTVYRRVPDIDNCDQKVHVQLRNVKRNPVTGKIKVGGWCKTTKNGNRRKKKFGEVDGEDCDEDDDLEPDESDMMMEHRQIPCFTTVPVEKYHVINDLVVDRGPSPYMSLLELFGDDQHLTTVQADGLAISTPTGSTAYSLSAGGSLTHPEIHATLITPICPHTLSFRPTLVPDSMELRICVPYNSRNTAWASFDGRGRVELKQGDHIKVTASKYPFPTVCKEDQATDWFRSLSNCLHWNIRQRQKSFAVVESNNRPGKRSAPSTPSVSRVASNIAISRMAAINPSSPASAPGTSTVSQRKTTPPSKGSTTSSDNGQDEVFGMFIDDDSPIHRLNIPVSDVEDDDQTNHVFLDDDDDDDDDDNQSESEGDEFQFNGWTDKEILKAQREAFHRKSFVNPQQ
ncbi:ATP-NAD kinase-like domain-containing protein [Dichotomocladium elegans]|nr:ATP-NAD kinase-like domain-containing protein [Dichotomocladium elegans]